MPGQVLLANEGPIARVTLSHPGKLNAISRAMWRELRAVFLLAPLPWDLSPSAAAAVAGAYRYADSPEHREDILAFLEKRKPEF